MDNAIFDPCFNRWYSGVLSAARLYYQDYLLNVAEKARFGIDVTAYHKRHDVLTRTLFYLVAVYWRAWDYNTWYAPDEDNDSCPEVLPLGSFVPDDMYACLLREGDCHGLDLRPLLRIAGVRPLPDGIGVMQIQGNTGCNSILFQVDKARNNSAPPSLPDDTTLLYNI